MATSSIDFPILHKGITVPGVMESRIELQSGGVYRFGFVCLVQFVFVAKVTAANSPAIAGSQVPASITNAALQCIDITNGIGNAIEGSIPCGISEGGTIYVKKLEQNHIYAITGFYRASIYYN